MSRSPESATSGTVAGTVAMCVAQGRLLRREPGVIVPQPRVVTDAIVRRAGIVEQRDDAEGRRSFRDEEGGAAFRRHFDDDLLDGALHLTALALNPFGNGVSRALSDLAAVQIDPAHPGLGRERDEPGVRHLRRHVNEQAIGIQGHSWGGYQIAYMVTQTNRFKAAEAGAPRDPSAGRGRRARR